MIISNEIFVLLFNSTRMKSIQLIEKNADHNMNDSHLPDVHSTDPFNRMKISEISNILNDHIINQSIDETSLQLTDFLPRKSLSTIIISTIQSQTNTLH